jgi:D-alanyl-D-alanine carboxypeptidase (penicillin-binding protein 5/6)
MKKHAAVLTGILSATTALAPVASSYAATAHAAHAAPHAAAPAHKPASKKPAASLDNGPTLAAPNNPAVILDGVTEPTVTAPYWLVMDATSGAILGSRNAQSRIDPASLTKIMTAYLVFRAITEKRLSADQMVTVSTDAWKVAPGSSRMFLEPGAQVSINDLLLGLLVQSGNDAAVALAEAEAGSENAFVAKMNQEAAAMGLKGTHFASPHGLPDPQTYSTPEDLAIMSRRLIVDYPDLYKRYDEIKEYTYHNIKQPNRNRLLWHDPSVDGLKTGHTEAAGYCIIGSAHRPGAAGDRRIIAVVLGSPSDRLRTQEAQVLLNWGFGSFETLKLYSKDQSLANAEVWKGTAPNVRIGFDQDVYLTVPREWAAKVKQQVVRQPELIAPLDAGAKVGTVDVQVDGKSIQAFPVVALEPVPQAGFLGRSWDSVRLWVHNLTGGSSQPAS